VSLNSSRYSFLRQRCVFCNPSSTWGLSRSLFVNNRCWYRCEIVFFFLLSSPFPQQFHWVFCLSWAHPVEWRWRCFALILAALKFSVKTLSRCLARLRSLFLYHYDPRWFCRYPFTTRDLNYWTPTGTITTRPIITAIANVSEVNLGAKSRLLLQMQRMDGLDELKVPRYHPMGTYLDPTWMVVSLFKYG
jgi:hypothetical protein